MMGKVALLAGLAVSASVLFGDEVLVAREGHRCVERWSVKSGRWTKSGTFLSGESAIGLAAANGAVYVAATKKGGAGSEILKYAPDGRRLGVFAESDVRADQLTVTPDGRTLVATSLPGHRLLYWDLGTGKGGSCPVERSPRAVAFGPDGLCYVACRETQRIAVYDFDGKGKCAQKGAIGASYGMGGFAFAGPDLTKVVIPGSRVQVADLVARTLSRHPKGESFVNSFASVHVGGRAYAADWARGTVTRVAAEPGAAEDVVTDCRGICAMLNLTAALSGADRAETAAAGKRLAAKGTKLVYEGYEPPPGEDFDRMKFNNPGAVVELSFGIWPSLLVDEYSPEGDNDIRIAYGSVPSKGFGFFRNPTPKGRKDPMPVFRAPVPEGPPRRMRPAWPDHALPAGSPHFRGDRGRSWSWADLNGDGRLDAVCAVNDWTDYGVPGPACPVAYDENEKWTNAQIQVYFYWYENLGGQGAATKWGEPQALRVGGLRTQEPGPFGMPSCGFRDWDGDGDIDLAVTDGVSDFWYFENVGTAKAPEFAKGRRLVASDGSLLEGELCMMSGRFIDWDGDGLADVVASEEDGRVSFYRNTGRVKDRMPVFDGPRYFRQEADDLKFHCIPTPCGVDWDGDGDWDLITGDTTGFIAFIENLSGPGVEHPKWAPPVELTVRDPKKSAYRWTDGRRIRSTCGPENSPQGPFEQKWGYTQVCVADWDGDGFLDILANDVKGSVVWFRNPGKAGATEMFAARPIEVEWTGPQPQAEWEWRRPPKGKALRAPWRTTPIAIDWNRDGLVDLVMLDHEGVLVLYERAKRKGRRVLLPPKRVFADANGAPLVMAAGKKGGAGRRKMCFADWNGDGRPDLIANSVNAAVYLNLGEQDGRVRFANPQPIGRRRLAGHPCCPTTVDFNADGVPDVVIGAEDGYFYYKRHNPAEDD